MSGSDATASFHLALNAEGGVPSEIMLLPAGNPIRTFDNRGPYRVPDAARLVAASLSAAAGRPMPIDENHATDLAAPKGGPSPARGWLTGLQARADGIWASVDWTGEGKQLVADRAYRGVSVVFRHLADGTITRIERASLVNNPNLRGLVALNAEGVQMDLLKQLCELLGLPADSDAAAVIAKIKGMKGDAGVATQAQLTSIAKAAGAKEDADIAAVLAAVTTLAAERAKLKGSGDAVTVLQAELATVTTSLNALKTEHATERATAFVDGAIKAGRVGVKPLREHYIARHASDPTGVEKEIGAMPILGPSGASIVPPAKDKDGKVALNAEQASIARMLGHKPGDMQKTIAAEAADEEAA